MLKTQPVKILLKHDPRPYAVNTAQKVPMPLLKAVKEELKWMEADIMEAVTEPIAWCAQMVPVSKKDWKSLHLCGRKKA